jgi:hypothetical protein
MSVLKIENEIKRQLQVNPDIDDRALVDLVAENLKLTCKNYILQHIKFVRGDNNE